MNVFKLNTSSSVYQPGDATTMKSPYPSQQKDYTIQNLVVDLDQVEREQSHNYVRPQLSPSINADIKNIYAKAKIGEFQQENYNKK